MDMKIRENKMNGESSNKHRETARRGAVAEDLTGQKFGALTVLYRVENRGGRTCWACRCVCGNIHDATAHDLKAGKVKSCGYLKRKNQKEIYQRLHFVDGTCLELIEKRKYRRDNASGFRGVFQMKNGHYRVSIGFKGKRYYVGAYEEYDQAVAARQEAEHLIHDGFLRDYRLWQKKAAEDPAWADENPFVFEVEKKSGGIEIISSMRREDAR